MCWLCDYTNRRAGRVFRAFVSLKDTLVVAGPNESEKRSSICGDCHVGPVRFNKREERQVIEAFEFEDQGHRFYCATEAPRHTGMQTWWWFSLDGDKTTRYAPFEESSDDTQLSVQARIISYYADLLAIQARPRRTGPFFRKQQRQS